MSESVPRVSAHARQRWIQRSDSPDLEPLDAWIHGTPISGHDLDADETRYHQQTGTVLLRRGDTLVTVIDVETAKPGVLNAVLEVLA